MSAGACAIVITAITASLLVVFLWLGEVRTRWKALAVTVFSIALFLSVSASAPAVFAAALVLQTFLAIALSVYFKAAF